MRTLNTRKTISLALLVLLLATAACADELNVMVSGAFTAAYAELVPEFERTNQTKVKTVFGASMGNAPDSIPVRLAKGEPADVLILAAPALDDLIKQGKAVAGSRVDLVNSVIGMAVRQGTPKPDVSTVEALKRTLLEAKSIAYSDSASGIYLSTQLIQRLGIADQVLPKCKMIRSERVGTVVARGDADIGFQQISELLPIAGIDFVGPLPPEVQKVTVFAAGIATGAKDPDRARELIRFLASPTAFPAMKKSGLEPIASSLGQMVMPPPTPYGAPISLEAAKKAASAARAEAQKNNWLMAIAVVDPAGMLVYFERMDGVQNASVEVAEDKARSAALFKRPTKVFMDAVARGGEGIRFLQLRGVVPLDGGIPLIVDGKIIGAIGLSGGAGEQDGECAKAGAEALTKP